MSHSMDMTQIFKIAHSLCRGHSLISLCFAAATEQVSRQSLHHQQVIDQHFRPLLCCVHISAQRHLSTKWPCLCCTMIVLVQAHMASDIQLICACFYSMIKWMYLSTRQNAPKISAVNLDIRVCAHTSDLCWKKVESYSPNKKILV